MTKTKRPRREIDPIAFGTFRCKWCSENDGWCHKYNGRCSGDAGMVKLTGEFKRNKKGKRVCQYTCMDCGFTGWSSHPDLAECIRFLRFHAPERAKKRVKKKRRKGKDRA